MIKRALRWLIAWAYQDVVAEIVADLKGSIAVDMSSLARGQKAYEAATYTSFTAMRRTLTDVNTRTSTFTAVDLPSQFERGLLFSVGKMKGQFVVNGWMLPPGLTPAKVAKLVVDECGAVDIVDAPRPHVEFFNHVIKKLI